MGDVRDELDELDVQNYEQKSFVPYNALKDLSKGRKITALIQALSDKGQVQVYQPLSLLLNVSSLMIDR